MEAYRKSPSPPSSLTHTDNPSPVPNGWGKQSYNEEFREYQKDSTLSNVNRDKKHQKSFILQFMEDRIDGIRLRQEGLNQQTPTGHSHFIDGVR